ncbi:MAG: hypothetical protein KC944_23655, partial [Candidatus Omnitrophica bacterium]|nr:hypothetical protein [Candidatus Omnitrophota bacterium]
PDSPINVHVTLPLEDERQTIRKEIYREEGFVHDIEWEDGNRIANFRGENLKGEQSITYSFRAQTSSMKFNLPEATIIPATSPSNLKRWLETEEYIESDDPAILAKSEELMKGDRRIKHAVTVFYDFVSSGVAYKPYKGKTSAVTALKLREASCNGKNRLLVALCRSQGIPARIAGGLVLSKKKREEAITKKTTHSWTEIYINGQWVPFCPTNGYFAEIPAHYLELYKGDRAFIIRTKNIDFDYRWKVSERRSSEEEVLYTNATNYFNILRLWATLEQASISLNLLVIILTIPIGATVVAFARNVIGLVPFGTFMPALIAVAFRDTGLAWGVILFTITILSCGLFWPLLEKAGILHVPRMAIILTLEVMIIVGIALVAINFGYKRAAAISLFPLAVLTLTTERFVISIIEEGWSPTLQRFAVSLLVATAAYLVMRWTFLENLIIAYPELLLSVIGVNLLLGSWTGLRLTEFIRFRSLYLRGPNEMSGQET